MKLVSCVLGFLGSLPRNNCHNEQIKLLYVYVGVNLAIVSSHFHVTEPSIECTSQNFSISKDQRICTEMVDV